MPSVSRGVRALSPYLGLVLGLVLAACGGGTSSKNDAASGTDGAAGNADGSDGAAGTGGAAGMGTAGTAGQGGHDGGAAGGGGAAGADAGGDVATEAGAAGNDGGTTGAAGSDGGAGGSEGGVAGSSGSDGGDATAIETPLAGGLCDPFPIQSPVVTPTIINNGKAPDTAGFIGGTLATGTYFMTAVVHFGATYTGATQEVLVIDAAAKTGVDASVVGTTTKYVGDTISFPSTTVITGTPSCGGTTAMSANYLVTGTGAGSTLSLNAVGSSDIKVFTKQ